MLSIKPYLEVLRNTNFTKLWISQVCSQLTNYLLSFVILIRVFDLTGSSLAVSVLIISFGLATVFFGAVAGVYADRFDRKWILTIINFCQAATVILFIFLDHNLWALALITFIYSALNQFYLPAEAPSIPNLVPREQILIANSYFAFTGSVALIIGFAAAGPLTLAFGREPVYEISALLLIIAGLATLVLPSLKPQQNTRPAWLTKLWHEFKEGLAHFWDNKNLHFPLLSLVAIQVVNGMLITIAPAFIQKLLGFQLEQGMLLMVLPLGLGVLTGALLLGFENKYIEKRNLILAGFLGMGLIVAALAFVDRVSERFVYYAVLAFLLGIFNSHIFAPSHSLLQTHALSNLRGRVYGSLYTLLQIAATLPTFIIGILADQIALFLVVLGLGIALIILGLLLKFKTTR